MRALNDLIVAITIPHISSINCARAVDAIKHLISPTASTDKQAWEQMQSTLHLDKKYLTLVTDISKDARHGKGTHVSGSMTTEATQRAWTVMNRYFEFRKRGNKPLPISDFPLLKG